MPGTFVATGPSPLAVTAATKQENKLAYEPLDEVIIANVTYR